MKDSIGDRMKNFYEVRTRYLLPRRAFTLIRVDGKAFHTFTRGLKRPFDDDLIDDMNATALYLCKNIMGAKFGFVQSDEISILVTDFAELTTEMWFDGNIQKICSVSASMATSAFNKHRLNRLTDIENAKNMKWAEFDSRVFQIPAFIEVCNYFIWRQQDATRNSIASTAQSLYSQKQLNGKKSNELQELIFQKGTNWNDYPAKYKRGRGIVKVVEAFNVPNVKSRWEVQDVPIFTENDYLAKTLSVVPS